MTKIEKVDINTVIPNENNPRFINEDQLQKLKKSIIDFPEMLEKRPILVNSDMVVLGGNMRLRALKEIGKDEAHIIKVDWSEEKQREFIIKDNLGYGEWDLEELQENWDIDDLEGWGLELTSFEEDLEGVEGEGKEVEEDDFDEDVDEVKTDIKLGDIIEIGKHRLMCGDSTKEENINELLNGVKIDMVFTDPPYGMFLDTDYSKIKGSDKSIGFKGDKKGNKYEKIIGDNEDFTDELITNILSYFDKVKEVFLFGADYYVDLLPNFGKNGSWSVWNKRSSEAQQKGIGNTLELIWSKRKHKRLVYDFEWFGFLSKDDPKEARNRVHPSMKPSKLISKIIQPYIKDVEFIIDPYLGSGATMLAVHQLDRVCYGMELDPKYCQLIINRMINLDDTLEVKINGKEYKKEEV